MNNACDWDKIWADTLDDREFLWWLERENSGVRGRKIFSYLSRHLGKIEGAKAIEIGAGTGVYSLIFARRGAQVTLLDYCQGALELARKYWETFGVSASFVYQDALKLDAGLREKFDLAMSFGTVEHYRQPQRFFMAKAHLDLVRPGGIVIISVPNRYFLPHELLKFYLQKKDKWHLDYEGAFTRGELLRLGRSMGLENIEVGGSAFIGDIVRYLHILKGTHFFSKFYPRQHLKNAPLCELGIPIDELFGADIFLMGRKPL